jgi:glycosyltransferase involved in cell wall biosynthesis
MIPARNRGFNEATGDILVKTDADTQVPTDWVKKKRKLYENKLKPYLALFHFTIYQQVVLYFLNFYLELFKLLFHQNFYLSPTMYF